MDHLTPATGETKTAIVHVDLSPHIGPHGEDDVSYSYERGKLNVSVLCISTKRSISLHFDGCAYQYFGSFPGHRPWEPSGTESTWPAYKSIGRVVERFDTVFLDQSKEIFSQISGVPSRLRHFQVFFDSFNKGLDVLATNFSFDIVPDSD